MISDLVTEATRFGIKFQVRADGVSMRSSREPPPDLIEALRQHRNEVKAYLLEPRHKAWRLIVDGKILTMVGPPVTERDAREFAERKFGSSRVTSCCSHAVFISNPGENAPNN